MASNRATTTALTAGGALGLLLVAWTFVMAATGWYRDPELFRLFWVQGVLQAAVLALALYRTRPGRGYRAQLGVGLAASAVASILVFIGTLLITAAIFGDYFEDLRAMQARTLRADGLTEAAVKETLEEAAPARTPGGRAFAGLMGTLGTGFVVSAVAAALLRDRRSGGS